MKYTKMIELTIATSQVVFVFVPSNVPPKPGFKDIPVNFTLNDERDLS